MNALNAMPKSPAQNETFAHMYHERQHTRMPQREPVNTQSHAQTLDVLTLLQQLDELLPEVKSARLVEVRYGDAQSRFHDALVIRITNTLGGCQWQVRNVNSLGQEFASDYLPLHTDLDDIKREIMTRVQHYHRPHPNRVVRQVVKEYRAGSPALTFFGITEAPCA